MSPTPTEKSVTSRVPEPHRGSRVSPRASGIDDLAREPRAEVERASDTTTSAYVSAKILIMRSHPLIIVGLSACALGLYGPGQASSLAVTTGVDLVIQAASAAVQRGVTNLDASRDSVTWQSPMLVVAQEKHEANWIIEHLLIEQMLSRGTTVVLDSAGVSAYASRLAYRIVDLNIRGSSGLLGSSVSRECRITTALRLSSESDGAVLWQDESSGHQGDRVPKTHLDALNNDDFGFADIQIENRSWGKIAEPAIVSGVLGSLVYFFFSNR